jgi:prepilin-type N-terminal cleavage/methylation domain-containing protein
MTYRFQLLAKDRKGFTLVELTVVIVVIGVLAAFGVPQLLTMIERSKAGEAFHYLASVREAQETYLTRQGTFARNVADLDIQLPPPRYFSIGAIAAGQTKNLQTSWTLTLTRHGASSGYGAYTVTFTEDGFDPKHSTISSSINPMGT